MPNKGDLYVSLIENRIRLLQKKKNTNKSLNDLKPESYSDEKYFEEKSKNDKGSELLKLIKRKLS